MKIITVVFALLFTCSQAYAFTGIAEFLNSLTDKDRKVVAESINYSDIQAIEVGVNWSDTQLLEVADEKAD